MTARSRRTPYGIRLTPRLCSGCPELVEGHALRLAATALVAACLTAGMGAEGARPRARDIGLSPGVFQPGPLNAITDVGGVRVGQKTRVDGDLVRTGVTVVVPHEGNLFQDKVAGAVFVGNAFGKLAGSAQVAELGTIETPVVLTNTLNDGGLNDIRGLHVTTGDVIAAISSAAAGPVDEGSVGAGTGTQCYGWKGGIGTSSRVLPARYGGYTLGVLVQINFGGVLTMGGAPVGKELGKYAFAPPRAGAPGAPPTPDGSCMIVVATDAPIDARDLRRLAARAVFALGRTGSSYSNGSGDFAVAFTTSPSMRTRHGESQPRERLVLPPEGVSPLFQAALEATEEAVYNSLLRATTVSSRQGTAEAIPIDRVVAILRKCNVVR